MPYVNQISFNIVDDSRLLGHLFYVAGYAVHHMLAMGHLSRPGTEGSKKYFKKMALTPPALRVGHPIPHFLADISSTLAAWAPASRISRFLAMSLGFLAKVTRKAFP